MLGNLMIWRFAGHGGDGENRLVGRYPGFFPPYWVVI